MARGLEKAQYTADDAKVYTVRIKKNYVANADLGWTAGDGADGALPRRFKMRHVVGVDADGFRRSIYCGTNDCTLYTTPGHTFDMGTDDGGSSTFTRTGRVGEAATD